MSDYQNLRKTMNILKQEAQEHLTKEISTFFENFFSRNKDINTIAWVQYTPYFNDGEPCVFSVITEDIYINDVWSYSCADPNYIPVPNSTQIQKEIGDFLSTIHEDDLREIFGEGKIVVSRDGTIKTEDYHHD